LDGSIIHNARTLLVNMSLVSSSAKLLKHAGKSDPQTCLGEISFGVNLEATVIAQGPLSVEKLYVGVTNTQAIIHECIYEFAQRTKVETLAPPSLEPTTSPTELIYNLLPIIPKNFSLKIENSILNGMRDDSKADFNATIKSLLINSQMNQSTSLQPIKNQSSRLPQLFLSFQVANIDVKCNKNSVFELSKISIDGNYEEDVINLDLLMDKLTVCYDHLLMKPWIVNNFLKAKKMSEKRTPMLIRSKSGWFDYFSNTCKVAGCIELWKVCLWCHLPDNPKVMSVGFHHTKFQLDKSPDLRNKTYDSPIGKILFGRQHWSSELLVEACWFRLGSSLLNTDTHMLKKYHTWGTPLFLGVALVKIRSQGAQEVKIHSMIDLFRTEWSPELSKSVLQCLKCAKEYSKAEVTDQGPKKTSVVSNVVYTVNVACTNANFYWLTGKDICLMLRLDKMTFDDLRGKMDWLVEGAKISSVKPTSIQHGCVRSEDIKVCISCLYCTDLIILL